MNYKLPAPMAVESGHAQDLRMSTMTPRQQTLQLDVSVPDPSMRCAIPPAVLWIHQDPLNP